MPILLLFSTVTCNPTLAQEPGEEALSADEVTSTSPKYRVKIADPFIELHTGPGGGYPIFYVIDRGTEVNVLRRKTDWYRLETDDGKSGWASREQMKQTLTPGGEKFRVIEYDQDDFMRRRWVLGVTGGEFEAAPVFTVFTAYSFTENLAAEIHIGQSVGSRSSSTFIKTNLVMQPLPDLTYSPYLSLGLGKINIDPSATLIVQVDEENNFGQVGLGIQRFVSRNFLFRFEANEYVIFSSDAIRSDNEVVSEWKFGFAVFF
ncbi:MAG: SH3 domain-containing protein [Gammaproteobacteria bacterium]|nr:SH3 domain-containing protein [Gammaproteobacteria bacterium]MDH3535024.1 SH3 domain-containing protein [Gammaproteobacteria bacterium]